MEVVCTERSRMISLEKALSEGSGRPVAILPECNFSTTSEQPREHPGYLNRL